MNAKLTKDHIDLLLAFKRAGGQRVPLLERADYTGDLAQWGLLDWGRKGIPRLSERGIQFCELILEATRHYANQGLECEVVGMNVEGLEDPEGARINFEIGI